MKFIGEFVEQLNTKQTEYRKLLHLDEEETELRLTLQELLDRHWHALPDPEKSFINEYAVDSSSASRSLNIGVEFFIIRALMLGSNNESWKKLYFEMVKGIREYNVSSDFERLLRDLIEIEVVIENISKVPDDSIILIDGNLYGRFTHLLKELKLRGWRYLPLKLIDKLQTLFRLCESRKIMLAGVSKFSKTRVFTSALLREKYPSIHDPGYLDTELLYWWKKNETGYTTPLLLGEYAIEKEVRLINGKAESYRERFFENIEPDKKDWGTRVIEKIPYSPAIVMFHIIPNFESQPLRIDIPACCLGINKKILDVEPFDFIDHKTVERVLEQLVIDFGGRDVYNALLYIVDREVRLEAKPVDQVYRSILSHELGISIEYDRSSRRFQV
jgi:hypothetical protein